MIHPCWHTAIHEASHLAVYLQLGGKWKSDYEIHVQKNFGSISLNVLWDKKFGPLLEVCVLAAGIASDRLNGVPSINMPGTDIYQLNDWGIDLGLSEADKEYIITRIEHWLRKNHLLIEDTAKKLLCATSMNGRVVKSKSKKIVSEMQERLYTRRSLCIGPSC
jgi:hypothetical protein